MTKRQPDTWRTPIGRGSPAYVLRRSDDHVEALRMRHVIADISYRAEAITCSCGTVVTAPPDELEHDRHRPLVEAWESHKREAAVVRRGRGAAA